MDNYNHLTAKGQTFIRAYERAYEKAADDPNDCDEPILEMDRILQSVLAIEPRLPNWALSRYFFSAGANPQSFMARPSREKDNAYDRFFLNLLWQRDQGIKPSVEIGLLPIR